MNATRPEAGTEYSTGRWAVSGLGLLGAGLLVAAEFTALVRVQTVARPTVLVRTVELGPHHGWAMLPIAALVALLSIIGLRTPRRGLTPALLVLGAAALAIGLIVDLPSVHDVGVVGSPATGLHEAQARAGAGLYLETLGAVAVLLAAVTAAVLGGARRRTAQREPEGDASLC